MTNQELFTALRERLGNHLAFDETAISAAYEVREKQKINIFLRIVSLLGGFFAALSIIGFCALFFKSSEPFAILGLLFVSGTIFVSRQEKSPVVDTLCISFFIAGMGLLIFGFGESLFRNENAICVFMAFVALVCFALTENFALSFLSVYQFFMAIFALFVINKTQIGVPFFLAALSLLFAFLLLKEALIINISDFLQKRYHALRIGLLFSYIMVLGFNIVRYMIGFEGENKNFYPLLLPSITAIGLILWVVYLLFPTLKITKTNTKIGVLVAVLVILSPTIFTPAISGSLLIILLAFYVNYSLGIGLGIAMLIFSISKYYYDLNMTLLQKSGVLFLTGLLFLLAYFFTDKLLLKDDTTEKI